MLLYEDDGVGFDQGQDRHSGLGLNSIESRVELHGGTIDVKTALGEGVSYVIELSIE